MSSQKSIAATVAAVAPIRQRGRARVEAILQTATELFVEKGYEAVTMTEVAARSNTAIGSLYRFFPTKEALAGALLERYGTHLTDMLDQIVRDAGSLAPAEIAAALVALVRTLHRERSAVLPLIDVQSDGIALRSALREGMRERLAVLAEICGTEPEDRDAKSIILQHLMKVGWALAQTDAEQSSRTERELHRLLALYLGS